jgi:2-polyprenyl-3-methyl-5-hydroxy-6-metoxy-1,4-benzoquinol methylase
LHSIDFASTYNEYASTHRPSRASPLDLFEQPARAKKFACAAGIATHSHGAGEKTGRVLNCWNDLETKVQRLMSRHDEARWDRRHAAVPGPDGPSNFLAEMLSAEAWSIPTGRALDIACGQGRNALFLAARGFDVTAVDISSVALAEARRRALARSLAISWQLADLEQFCLPQAQYDLIVNFNYLQRSLIRQIHSALTVGGHVVFETYLIDQQEIGHPKNPEYLLAHNELLELFRSCRVLYYREGKLVEAGEISFRAGILAQKVG